MISTYKSYIWLLPFCFFLVGYIGIKFYLAPCAMVMPSLIGLNSLQALITLSDYNLTPSIIAYKEIDTVSQGTILQQNPLPGQMVKKKQSVFLVVATASQERYMANYLHKSCAEIQKSSKKEQVTLHIHHIPHVWPHARCFAQWPQAHTPLSHKTPIVYISSGYEQPIIWPNFIGQDVQKVETFLKENHMVPDIISHYSCADMATYAGKRIVDQRPLPGSCVYIDKPNQFTVQLRVE